jgi:hypothetical protein
MDAREDRRTPQHCNWFPKCSSVGRCHGKGIFQHDLHKIGHCTETTAKVAEDNEAVDFVTNEVIWCARRDSNSRPNAPEAFALSS